MPTILRNVKSDDPSSCSFVVIGNQGIANAIRRALMNNVSNVAPANVLFRENTSCQSDEYIAHRIGLVPFKKVSDADIGAIQLHLRAKSTSCFAEDFVGVNDIAPCLNVPIMKLGAGQTIDISVTFEVGTGEDHARFSHIGPVSFCDKGNENHLSFSTFGGKSGTEYSIQALEALLRMLDNTTYFVETEYDARRRITSL